MLMQINIHPCILGLLDVRDAGVSDERHPPGQAYGEPDAAVSGHAGGRGARGRVPQPLVRRAGRLLHRRCHCYLSGEETTEQGGGGTLVTPWGMLVGNPRHGLRLCIDRD